MKLAPCTHPASAALAAALMANAASAVAPTAERTFTGTVKSIHFGTRHDGNDSLLLDGGQRIDFAWGGLQPPGSPRIPMGKWLGWSIPKMTTDTYHGLDGQRVEVFARVEYAVDADGKRVPFYSLAGDARYYIKLLPAEEKTMRRIDPGQTVSLIPDEVLAGPGGLTLKHLGYGHKISKGGGDFAFLELELRAGHEATTLRVTTPVRTPVSETWRGWQVTVLQCENQGPPHDRKARTEIRLE